MAVLEARSRRVDDRSAALPGSPGGSREVHSPEDPATQTCCGARLRPFWADDGRYISVCKKCGQETTHKHMVRYNGTPWIGVDLDGTLAREVAAADDPDQIGEPVEPMMKRVRAWLEAGQTVKIFTARASVPRQVALVKDWLKTHGLPDLEVTNAKDFRMLELWDDRAVQVDRNSGQPVESPETSLNRKAADVRIVARRKRNGSFVSKLRMFFAL